MNKAYYESFTSIGSSINGLKCDEDIATLLAIYKRSFIKLSVDKNIQFQNLCASLNSSHSRFIIDADAGQIDYTFETKITDEIKLKLTKNVEKDHNPLYSISIPISFGTHNITFLSLFTKEGCSFAADSTFIERHLFGIDLLKNTIIKTRIMLAEASAIKIQAEDEKVHASFAYKKNSTKLCIGWQPNQYAYLFNEIERKNKDFIPVSGLICSYQNAKVGLAYHHAQNVIEGKLRIKNDFGKIFFSRSLEKGKIGMVAGAKLISKNFEFALKRNFNGKNVISINTQFLDDCHLITTIGFKGHSFNEAKYGVHLQIA